MLLSRDRLFERKAPTREAKIIYIFCEGANRELRYFQYFREMDSRIHLEIYELHSHMKIIPRKDYCELLKPVYWRQMKIRMPNTIFRIKMRFGSYWIPIRIKQHLESLKSLELNRRSKIGNVGNW